MAELRHDNWSGTTYGNARMHRWLISLLRVIGVRPFYLFAALFVVTPTMLINRRAAKEIYRLYRRRMDRGRLNSLWMTYRNHCEFSKVVIDRFAMYGGKRFNITIEGLDKFNELAGRPEGFVQLSSHIGNYEIAGYSLVAETKRFNALVFAGEKSTVMANRTRLFAGNNIRMIPMSADMSHLFEIDRALSDGEILSMPADRVFGSQKCFRIPFFGKEAKFPQGPFIVAALRGLPLLFVAVMKKNATTYHISVRRLDAPDTTLPLKDRACGLAAQYAALLETTVRENPLQWYNYFDFWAK